MSALPSEGRLVAHPAPRRTPLFPAGRVTGYTVDDWLKLPETGERIELIDGNFSVSPVPMGSHALCAGGLRAVLTAAARAAKPDLVVVETVNVQTGDDGLIPDVAVVPRDLVMARTVVFPASDVAAVAEIVSPGLGNRRRDYEIKPPKYAKAGIGVFIRVEIEGADIPRVEVFQLGPDGYEMTGQTKAGELVTLTEPFPASFDPAELLEA
ncbi:Uma2 family endonuclease [Nonomuraea sp. K274]|uniref:Uma2 family endonuclease n=1 Tax=Nonomuraea cypriaca TaxID=1187855 RepID=A0A931A957_9ACTN|nr:Uma2 family endonuclease [Nonomuraea cypriaca]MBF8185102.1 Uma2 family endonuclease [Nonomuraea cypriaca]